MGESAAASRPWKDRTPTLSAFAGVEGSVGEAAAIA